MNIAATDISIEINQFVCFKVICEGFIEHCDIKHDGSLLDSESFEINIYEILQIEKESIKFF